MSRQVPASDLPPTALFAEKEPGCPVLTTGSVRMRCFCPRQARPGALTEESDHLQGHMVVSRNGSRR